MRALELAIEFSLRDGSKLSLINVVTPPVVGISDEGLAEMKKAGEAVLDEAEAKCLSSGVKASKVLKVIENSSTAYEIDQYAVDGKFDCVILGSRGYAGKRGILMESLSVSLAISLPCTTIIVR